MSSGLLPIISAIVSGAQGNSITGLTGPNRPVGTVGGIPSAANPGSVTAPVLLKILQGIFVTSFTGLPTIATNKSITGVQGSAAVNTILFAPSMGANLAGLEAAAANIRFGGGTNPNINFATPRLALMQYLVGQGLTLARLPFSWELLQPILASSQPNSVVRNAYGVAAPGDLEPTFSAVIQQVLDNAVTAGMKIILDCHNSCIYQDFIYNQDGSVPSFTIPGQPIKPYTTDNTKVFKRLFSLNAAADPAHTVSQADFNALWNRIATKWAGHAGLAGYGLMHEPHDLPAANGTDPWFNHGGAVEDLTIWPTFAQSAINTIRAIDSSALIYVDGNKASTAVNWATNNPNFPLTGAGLVYDAHIYLDSASSGTLFDYSIEVAKGTSVGEGAVAINASTGPNRLAYFTTWLASNPGTHGIIGSTGMPVDNSNWATMFQNLMGSTLNAQLPVQTWVGGEYWSSRNYAINDTPGFYQGLTVPPLVEGYLKERRSNATYTLFDASPSYALSGAVTITVFCRGYVAAGFNVTVTRTAGTGTLSGGTIAIPAGVNPSATYTYTVAANEVATLTYSGPAQFPPARKVYSLTDPVTYAGATSLTDGAQCLMAKYGASRWRASDGYVDYVATSGTPAVATNGSALRAIWDSGYASTKDNIMEMVQGGSSGGNPNYGSWLIPTCAVSGGHTSMVMTDQFNSLGLWCKKAIPDALAEAAPLNKTLYNVGENSFIVACCSTSNIAGSGAVFQTGYSQGNQRMELSLALGVPTAHWIDKNGLAITCSAASALGTNVAAVITAAYNSGSGILRLNTVQAATGSASLASSPTDQHLFGWNFTSYYPNGAFLGNLYGAITGPGVPTSAELKVLEQYLGNTLAGMSL